MSRATAKRGSRTRKAKPRPPTRNVSSPWNRYPYPRLSTADIADQSYCEKRVHLWLQDPGRRISVPRQIEHMSLSALAHEALVDAGVELHQSIAGLAEPLAKEMLTEKIALGESTWVLETGWSAEFAGFPIGGVPDAVYFDHGRPWIVIDYKTVATNQLQMSHRVQLLIYGYLLEEAGYEVDGMLLACLLIPRSSGGEIPVAATVDLHNRLKDEATAISARRPSQRSWRVDNVDVGSGVCATLRAFRYERSRVESELGFATQFWAGTRRPWPTRKPAKCACCLYNQLRKCPSALVRFQSNVD